MEVINILVLFYDKSTGSSINNRIFAN